MRISDWSSDVCSSDLRIGDDDRRPCGKDALHLGYRIDIQRNAFDREAQMIRKRVSGRDAAAGQMVEDRQSAMDVQATAVEIGGDKPQIGRASCRERVCQDV